jgi:hypothetical protein
MFNFVFEYPFLQLIFVVGFTLSPRFRNSTADLRFDESTLEPFGAEDVVDCYAIAKHIHRISFEEVSARTFCFSLRVWVLSSV